MIRKMAFAALMFVCLASTAFSFQKKGEEEKVRTVHGVVTDAADAPVNGAVVQLKNSKTLQVRSFITQANGSYQFHGLDPNVDYALKADFQGASSPTRNLSSFDSRKEPVIDLKLEAKK